MIVILAYQQNVWVIVPASLQSPCCRPPPKVQSKLDVATGGYGLSGEKGRAHHHTGKDDFLNNSIVCISSYWIKILFILSLFIYYLLNLLVFLRMPYYFIRKKTFIIVELTYFYDELQTLIKIKGELIISALHFCSISHLWNLKCCTWLVHCESDRC